MLWVEKGAFMREFRFYRVGRKKKKLRIGGGLSRRCSGLSMKPEMGNDR